MFALFLVCSLGSLQREIGVINQKFENIRECEWYAARQTAPAIWECPSQISGYVCKQLSGKMEK